MKKLLLTALVALFAVSSSMAQTVEEIKASAARIEKLMGDAPAKCDIEGIDNLVAKCKSLAGSTAALGALTSKLKGTSITKEKGTELTGKLAHLKSELSGAGGMLKTAFAALKGLKNPLKIKSASKGITYAEGVVAEVGKEIGHQGSVISGLLHK